MFNHGYSASPFLHPIGNLWMNCEAVKCEPGSSDAPSSSIMVARPVHSSTPSVEDFLLSAIYRYPKTISGFMGSCIVKASPEIFTYISRALHHGCIHILTERHLPTTD